MSIIVQCQCGKKFQAKDESAGKRAKCPACGAVLVIGDAAAGTSARSVPKPADPLPSEDGPFDGGEGATLGMRDDSAVMSTPPPLAASAAGAGGTGGAARAGRGRSPLGVAGYALPKGPVEEAKRGLLARFGVSPALLVLIGIAIAVPTIIYLVKTGPVAAVEEFKKLDPKAQAEILDMAQQCLDDVLSGHGRVALRSSMRPRAKDMVWMETGLMWHLPSMMLFRGTTSLGTFQGRYYTRTGQIEMEINMYGRTYQYTAQVDSIGRVKIEQKQDKKV